MVTIADDGGRPERRPVQRRDAAKNRVNLLEATREVFAQQGPDASFDEIARAAGVSRTTLYRNFATREQLAAAVFEDNVLRHEEHARSLAGRPDGIVVFYDSVLRSTAEHLGITRVMMGAGFEEYRDISDRTIAAFESLLGPGRDAGIVRPGITVADVMLTLHLADTAIGDDVARGVPTDFERISQLLRTALFDLGGPG
jgi:AcrR family transcriptional regulator